MDQPSFEGDKSLAMNPISLMYHDIVEDGKEQLSGFSLGKVAYKLQVRVFRQHLDEVALRLHGSVVTMGGQDAGALDRTPLCLTFDDGGESAMLAAEILDRHGWKGHFFIPTSWIGRSGFLNEKQIRELSCAGHVIGSHSCSHPQRMSQLSPRALLDEWRESAKRLAEICEKPVCTASVPNGYYSREVAQAASLAGIRVLFTSEPTTRLKRIGRCTVLGRYTVRRGMTAALVAKIATGELLPRYRQSMFWQARKVAKELGGEYYLRFRDRLLASR